MTTGTRTPILDTSPSFLLEYYIMPSNTPFQTGGYMSLLEHLFWTPHPSLLLENYIIPSNTPLQTGAHMSYKPTLE